MKQLIFIRVLVLAVLTVLLYFAIDILVPVLISFVLFYILNPLVEALSNRRPKGAGLNRTFSVAAAIVVFFLAILLVLRFVVPPLAVEFGRLSENMPQYITALKEALGSAQEWYRGFKLPPQVNRVIGNSAENIVKYMVSFAQGSAEKLASMLSQFLNLIIIPIITFFLLRDKELIKKGFISFLPKNHRKRADGILAKIDSSMRNYFKGVFLLCIIVGIMVGASMYLLGLKYFMLLGVIAAITEFIPIIGPFIAAVPAVILAFLNSAALAFSVIIVYIAVQTLENLVIVPKIMGDKLKLHPLTILIAMLVFGKLLGAWGLFIAAPVTAVLKILYEQLLKQQNSRA